MYKYQQGWSICYWLQEHCSNKKLYPWPKSSSKAGSGCRTLGDSPKGRKEGKKEKQKREKEFDDSHWKPEAGLYQVKDEEKNLITVILSGM